MLEHILVPLDGTSESEEALPYVRRLVGLGASRITLLRAELPVAMDEYAMVSEAARDQARVYLQEVKARLSDLPVRIGILPLIGPPSSAALEAAEMKQISLIVIAEAPRPRLARMLLGSVSERIVQRSPVPVLVVPPHWTYDLEPPMPPELRPIRTVLVPLNAASASRVILPYALTIARQAKARLLLVSVLPSRTGPRPGAADHPSSDELEGAEEQLYEAGVQCAESGVDFTVLLEHGDPAERILSVCRERSADWIAMATRGRSGFSRWLTPSATHRVLRESSLPVLTTRVESSARSGIYGRLSVPGHS
jgi:nucleotide-binding universal stress UspA family protein